jgi:hypothetical protein
MSDLIYSNKCIYCAQVFTEENPCWSSYASSENKHCDGICKQCYDKWKRWEKGSEEEKLFMYRKDYKS